MELRTLGRTGIKVSPLCLGAMMFGGWGNQDEAECHKVIHTALDGGINFVDTADVYSQGESERIVGAALKGSRRDDVILATKFHGQMGEEPNHRGNSRRWIIKECEESLKRLQTDWIDLYQVHRPETPVTDIDETLGALSDLVHQGKVRYIGSSTFPAQDIVEAQWVAEKRGRERFVCEQPPYSIFVREIENAILPTCDRFDMGVIPWSPLDSGWLTGKYRKDEDPPENSRFARQGRWDTEDPVTQKKLELVEELAKLAADSGTSMVNLALAWVIRHTAITSAIIGPRTLEQLTDQMGAADVVLSDDVLDRIDELCPPGTNVGEVKHYYASQWLAPWRRRRPAHKG